MKMRNVILLFWGLAILTSCSNSDDQPIDEKKLGFIDAAVDSDETNFDQKAEFSKVQPGESETIDRSFENAPPLIPHTTEGFLPILKDNNVCLTCHMPDAAVAIGAVPLSRTHFSNLRPKPLLVNGKYELPAHDSIVHEELGYLNNQYFNCSQCHVPQANVSIDIKNLFTPEFREQHGLEKSDLRDKISEGIK